MVASRRLRKLQSQPGNKICVDRARVCPQQVERSKRERATSDEKFEEKRVLVNLLKEEGNHRILVGEIDEAILKYTEAIELCPLRYTNGRIVLYSNRAQCNSHSKSLWRISQAYDMKGVAKESLMDCIMFINGCIKSKRAANQVKKPYYAVRMISKQMDTTWLFKASQLKTSGNHPEMEKLPRQNGKSGNIEHANEEIMRILKQKKSFKSGKIHYL
ncbi:ARM-repeat/Tetratricopeptide repeat (TPR)-like protein [Abeliophyllum distichum]|uniref:ARM-repeat/Tetratricopeptide repeat (TPR)-like protein n=1 Tax=Abeliophyllum distichum TaxID=126358 RepID=A0ABD1Q363_9LAMI